MRIAVLPEQVILIVPTEGTQLTDQAVHEIRSAITAIMPGWRPIVFREGGEILDMREDPEAAAAAEVLIERLGTLV